VVHAIGNALANKVRQLLDQVGILQQHGAAGCDRERVLVAGDGTTGIRGGWWLIAPLVSPLFSSGRGRPGIWMGRLKQAVVFASQLLGPAVVEDDLDEVDPLEAGHEVG
jgi:hypothetical protein